MRRLTRLLVDAVNENIDQLPRRLRDLGVRFNTAQEEEFRLELREVYYRYHGAALGEIDPIEVVREAFSLIARMHLRLHDPHRSRDFARRCDRLRFVRGDLAGRNRHAVFGEDALRLVFVKVHLGIVSKALNRVANAVRGAGVAQGA